MDDNIDFVFASGEQIPGAGNYLKISSPFEGIFLCSRPDLSTESRVVPEGESYILVHRWWGTLIADGECVGILLRGGGGKTDASSSDRVDIGEVTANSGFAGTGETGDPAGAVQVGDNGGVRLEKGSKGRH